VSAEGEETPDLLFDLEQVIEYYQR